MEYKEKDEDITVLYEDPTQYFLMIPKGIYDKFLRKRHAGDVLALYTYYCYVAKWQRTNQPKATKKFCMKALDIGEVRFQNAKNILLSVGLIENIKRKDGGWYIKIPYLLKKSTELKEHGKQGSLKDPENQVLGNPCTNTLNTNTKNALNTDTLNYIVGNKFPTGRMKRTKFDKIGKLKIKKQFLPLATQLSQIIKEKKNIHINTQKISTWADSFVQLHKTDKIEIPRLQNVLDWYEKNWDTDYCPVVESGKSFREKFTRLEDAIKRQKKPKSVSKISHGTHQSGEKIDYSQLKKKLYDGTNRI